MSRAPHIVIIAGEASGDVLGARLAAALKQRFPDARFSGVGGPRLQAEGLESQFPMQELAIMGLAEVLPHVPKLLRRIRELAAFIREQQPDVVVTVDAPDFNFRLAKKLQHPRPCPLIHYVAPSVWAWKPKRAQKIARLYDHLLTLLPFEPPYFEKHGLQASFVGHSIIEDWESPGNGAAFRQQHAIAGDIPLLCMLPGSRRGEISRHLPVYKETLQQVQRHMPELRVVMPVVPHLQQAVEAAVADWPQPPFIIETDARRDAFAACNAALAKSGTVTLELALSGVPMLVTYKMHPLTMKIMRSMMRAPYVTIVNLLLEQEIIPEFLQEQCKASVLAPALLQLLQDEQAAAAQRAAFDTALAMLGKNDAQKPGEKAAAVVAGYVKRPA